MSNDKNIERDEENELMVIFLILVLSNNWCLDDNRHGNRASLYKKALCKRPSVK